MKRTAVFYFTDQGRETAEAVAKALKGDYEISQIAPRGNLQKVTGDLFPSQRALVFVGSCGIAVRAIAPHLRGKAEDPAVLVIDEKGTFVISLLSGHMGGANDLARRLAKALGAVPVITTATDLYGRFSADAWAARQGLFIQDLSAAKRFSAEILKRDLPLFSDYPVEKPLPQGLFFGETGDLGLLISTRRRQPFGTTLWLIPPLLHLGIGLKRGIGEETIEEAVDRAFTAHGLSRRAIRDVSSIEQKQDEAGLLSFARAHNLHTNFYRAEALQSLPGAFAASDFVKKTVGTDNVCERAAMRAAGSGAKLIIRKTILYGVTVAAAEEKWRVSFE